MDEIVLIEGEELTSLKEMLEWLITGPYARVHKARFAIEDGQIKIKVNEETWSVGHGRLDPACLRAQDEQLLIPCRNPVDGRHFKPCYCQANPPAPYGFVEREQAHGRSAPGPY